MASASEFAFRTAFGLFWLTTMAIRIYFQMKARGSAISVTVNAQRSKLFFRLLALSYLLMLLYILSPWLDFASLPIPDVVRWFCGGGLLIAYASLFTWTHLVLGRNWSGLLEIHSDHSLVVTGPYRFIRHPMYTSFFLSGFGFLILSANWVAGGIYLVILTMMYFDRVHPEEQMMIDHFGEKYTSYMERTGRIFPPLKRLF